jgi:hypothetical protein
MRKVASRFTSSTSLSEMPLKAREIEAQLRNLFHHAVNTDTLHARANVALLVPGQLVRLRICRVAESAHLILNLREFLLDFSLGALGAGGRFESGFGHGCVHLNSQFREEMVRPWHPGSLGVCAAEQRRLRLAVDDRTFQQYRSLNRFLQFTKLSNK